MRRSRICHHYARMVSSPPFAHYQRILLRATFTYTNLRLYVHLINIYTYYIRCPGGTSGARAKMVARDIYILICDGWLFSRSNFAAYVHRVDYPSHGVSRHVAWPLAKEAAFSIFFLALPARGASRFADNGEVDGCPRQTGGLRTTSVCPSCAPFKSDFGGSAGPKCTATRRALSSPCVITAAQGRCAPRCGVWVGRGLISHFHHVIVSALEHF